MKKTLLVSLSVLSLLTLTGCDLFKKKEDKKEETKNENTQTSTVLPETGDEDEVIIKNPGAVIGTEIYDIKLNNKTSKLKIEYHNYSKSKLDEYNTYYVTYKVYFNDILIDGITGYIMYDQDEEIKELASYDNTKNFTYIGDTLNPTIIKGKDKEYLLIHIRGGGFSQSEDLYIINDKGNLLGNLYIDKNMGVNLTGKNASKYIDDESGIVMDYYYIESNKITYLALTDEMYKDEDRKNVDHERESYDFDEYVITINKDKLINTKTNNKYKGTDLEGGGSDFTEFFEEIIENTIKTKLNNKDIEIKLNVENVILNPDLNFVSININNENIVKFELDIPYNEETTFFEDFETQIIKGKDKEYLAIIFDYGKIDGLSAHKVYIVSEDKLIASFYDEENLALKLSGNGSDKYEKDEYGKNNKFYKIDTDKIYYLQPHDKNHGEYVDKVDLDEYVLTIENDKITTKKTGNTYVGTDLDGGDSEFVVIE